MYNNALLGMRRPQSQLGGGAPAYGGNRPQRQPFVRQPGAPTMQSMQRGARMAPAGWGQPQAGGAPSQAMIASRQDWRDSSRDVPPGMPLMRDNPGNDPYLAQRGGPPSPGMPPMPQPRRPGHQPWNPRQSGFATMTPQEQQARISELWKTRPEMRQQWRANAGSERFAEKRKSWGPEFLNMWQKQAAAVPKKVGGGPGKNAGGGRPGPGLRPRQPQSRPGGSPYQPHLPPQRGLPPGYEDRFAP